MSSSKSASELAISIRGLSKCYSLAASRPRATSLGEAVATFFRRPLRRRASEPFWALRDLSVDIHKGEVVGIIGRNGAGKSTLLKILSRITQPTTGRIDVWGRIGSLLEVGTGFHPELTGRENIFLNGGLLAMKRKEIERQFDAIVDFAEVEQFLDTPVKRYSSGMYVRLAFAVAAHLNPEILIVDEVLAVGDAEFQRKCLGKMKDVASGGRTVLFVSHSMSAIRNLCTTGILLDHGRVVLKGDVDSCVGEYLAGGARATDGQWDRGDKPATALSLTRIRADLTGNQPQHILSVTAWLRTIATHKPAFIAVDVLDVTGAAVMQALPTVNRFINPENREHRVTLDIHLPPLIPGQYSLTVWVGSHNSDTLDEAGNCVGFEIRDTPTKGRTFPHTLDHGYVVPRTTCRYASEHSSPSSGTPGEGWGGGSEPHAHAHVLSGDKQAVSK